jgi:DNA-binding NarL/FixJ family response regulator
MTTSLILVDDHPLVLAGLHRLIQTRPEFQVVGDYQHADAALEAIRRSRPDICVVDLNLAEGDGLTVLDTVIRERLPTKIILIAAVLQDAQVYAAVEGGVFGIVLKDWAAATLLECLATVADGRHWLPQKLVSGAIGRVKTRRRFAEDLLARLSPREREVAFLASGDATIKQVAHQLHVSEGTVKLHLHAIFRKLGVTRRADLITLMSRIRGSAAE